MWCAGTCPCCQPEFTVQGPRLSPVSWTSVSTISLARFAIPRVERRPALSQCLQGHLDPSLSGTILPWATRPGCIPSAPSRRHHAQARSCSGDRARRPCPSQPLRPASPATGPPQHHVAHTSAINRPISDTKSQDQSAPCAPLDPFQDTGPRCFQHASNVSAMRTCARQCGIA